MPTPISILDRSHISHGSDAATAIAHTISRAQHAEAMGFKRFWVSEHHGVPGVAGAAPAVLLAAVGQQTSRIRIGSGGVMLSNHQPLIVAEQFGTLAALFPGRIDLGLGRSLGFTSAVRRALRVEHYDLDRFAADLAELATYFDSSAPVLASPGANATLSLFILASGGSAEVAARAGLPVVFGGPKLLDGEHGSELIDRYRSEFKPSPFAPEPFVILNCHALAADTDAEAADLALSEAWAYVDAQTQGAFLPLESPTAIRTRQLTDRQRVRMEQMTAGTITGTADRVASTITDLVARTNADEVLLSGSCFDSAAQLHSDALLARALSSSKMQVTSSK
jgi:luciferase family oxidoreductase group 1